MAIACFHYFLLNFLTQKANLKIDGAAPTGRREKHVSFVWRPMMAAPCISGSWFCHLRVLGSSPFFFIPCF